MTRYVWRGSGHLHSLEVYSIPDTCSAFWNFSPDSITLWFVEALLWNYDKLHYWVLMITSLFSLFSTPSPQRLEDECGSKFQPSLCKANSLGHSYCLEIIQQHSEGHLIRIKGASITKETPRGFHKGSVSQMLLTLDIVLEQLPVLPHWFSWCPP